MDASFELCVWQPNAVLPYRHRFKALGDSALQQRVLAEMLRVHAVRGRAIEVQEILT